MEYKLVSVNCHKGHHDICNYQPSTEDEPAHCACHCHVIQRGVTKKRQSTITLEALEAGALALGYLDEFPSVDTWGSYEGNLIDQTRDVLKASIPYIRKQIADELRVYAKAHSGDWTATFRKAFETAATLVEKQANE